MTTTQEQAPVEALAEVMREFDWKQLGRQLTRDDYERAATAALLAIGYVDALRQPQARLTEEDCMVFATVLGHLKRNPDWLAEYQYMDALYDRLTSAPAQQVTREEIEQCIRSNVWVAVDETPCGIDEATDVIMSLLASRGLVKGA